MSDFITEPSLCHLRGLSSITEKHTQLIPNFPRDVNLGIRVLRNGHEFNVVQFHERQGTQYFGNISDVLARIQKRLPGSRINKKGQLTAPVSAYSALILSSVCPPGTLKFADKIAHLHYQDRLTEWALHLQAAKERAEYEYDGTTSELADSLVGSIHDPPTAYQRVAASISCKVPGYGLFMKQGTGKTYSAILAAQHRATMWRQSMLNQRATGPTGPFKILIVCPKAVVLNWTRELAKFTTTPGDILEHKGTGRRRTNRLINFFTQPSTVDEPKMGYDWVALIVPYGLMYQDIGILSNIPWGLTIIDESHFIMNPNTDRSQAALRLRDTSQARLALTGTATPNRPEEIYNQLEFLGSGYSGFYSKKAFRDACQVMVKLENVDTPQPQFKFAGIKDCELYQERMAMYGFYITKERALPDLPPQLESIVTMDMSSEQKSMYSKVLNELVIETESAIAEVEESDDKRMANIVLQNVLKRMLKLSEITSGFYKTDTLYDDDGELIQPSELHRFDPNPKLEKLISMLKELPSTSKAIVWTCFTQDILTISARLSIEGIDHVKFYGDTSPAQRRIAEDRFNDDPACRVWVGNSEAGGTGMNLQGQADEHTNCDHMFHYSQHWSGRIKPQANDRNHRYGTRVPCYIIDMVIPGTIDADKVERQQEKAAVSMTLMDVQSMLTRLAEAEHSNGGKL